jgi:hypothetical protein
MVIIVIYSSVQLSDNMHSCRRSCHFLLITTSFPRFFFFCKRSNQISKCEKPLIFKFKIYKIYEWFDRTSIKYWELFNVQVQFKVHSSFFETEKVKLKAQLIQQSPDDPVLYRIQWLGLFWSWGQDRSPFPACYF